MGGEEGRGGLGFMVCPSFVLGGDANIGSAGYVCLETELMGWESDFHAAMLATFAFAASMGWPSFFAVVCPAVLAALSGGMLCFAALSGLLRRFYVPAAMLFWAAFSGGYGGYACCDEYSLEFLFGAAMLIASLAVENTRLFILLGMLQVVTCVENWVPGCSSQEDEADLFEWVIMQRRCSLEQWKCSDAVHRLIWWTSQFATETGTLSASWVR